MSTLVFLVVSWRRLEWWWWRRWRWPISDSRGRRGDQNVDRIGEAPLQRRHLCFRLKGLGDEQVDGIGNEVTAQTPSREPERSQVMSRRCFRVERMHPTNSVEQLLGSGLLPGMGRNATELNVDKVWKHRSVGVGQARPALDVQSEVRSL